MDARQADIRADIYSLGCTLYCLLAGRPPFVEQTAMQTILAHRDKKAVPLHKVRSDVPAGLSAVVARMMAKEPEQRYRTPGAVAEALAPFCNSGNESAAAVSASRWEESAANRTAPVEEKEEQPRATSNRRPRPILGREHKRPRRLMGWVTAAGVLTLLMLIGITLLFSTKYGTVEIELNDPRAKVEVKVDGDTIDIIGAGKPLRLTAGPHHLRVTWHDFEAIGQSFTVKRGENPVLRVQLKLLTPRDKLQYLSDMQELDVMVTEGPPGVPRFATKGNLGLGEGNPRYGFGRIMVNGKPSPNGLSMGPAANTYARAKYNLGKKAQTFLASVALDDSAGGPGLPPGVGQIPTRLTFRVLGDGKDLWKSKPIDVRGDVQECKVDVKGIDVLELRVDCPGINTNAYAVWLEPRVN
jgi:hypothetical protein